jgi:F-type H+-transporting ATPase subunit b
MEALESFGINWKVLLGQGINFLILLFLMKKFIYPRFFLLLKERKEKIEKGIQKMEEAERKSKMVETEREKILKETKEKAQSILKETEERAKVKEREILEMAEKEKEKIIKEAKKMGEGEIEKLKEDFLKKNLELALTLTEKILAKKIDSQEDKKLIWESLKQLENHGR